MINKISFKNYKIFKDKQELELKPLTILIGKNSSGKSAVTKLLPLFESALSGELEMPLSLENYGVDLGSEFKDLVYGRYEVGDLEFGLETNGNNLHIQIASGTRISDVPKIISWKLNSEIELKYKDEEKKYLDVKNDSLHDCYFDGFNLTSNSKISENYGKHVFSLKRKGFLLPTNYIGPYRRIPNRLIKNSLQKIKIKDGKLGIDGKKAYPFLVWDTLYDDSLTIHKLSNWYEQNFEGWGLKVNIGNSPNFELELVRDNPPLKINFNDIGQGMIQALPLVLSSFIPPYDKDIINIFEQPELHLHPAAHGDLAERFANSALNSKKRYLIETHSQNFVLRLRRLVAEGKLDCKNLAIYFIDYNQEKGESNLKKISVDDNGDVDYWPSGVFSETLKETIAIRTAKKESPYNAN